MCIKLPQIIGYVKHFDNNKTMSFKASENKLLKKYSKIWKRVSKLINIKFDSENVYGDNDKYIKTQINSYADKVNTNFQGNEIPKENASCKYLSLIMLDSVMRANKRYYPQTLLENCKYKITRDKVKNLINVDLDSISSDESDSDLNNESDNEPDNDESNY